MKISINLLTQCPESIPKLAEIWHEVLGKIWLPEIPMECVLQNLQNHLNNNSLPLTFVASYFNVPIGMGSLRANDGVRPDLTPWLGSLVIHPNYQKRGIGKLLIETVKEKAYVFGFKKLYLSAFDPKVEDYYVSLGWKKIGMDEFKGHPVKVMEIEL